MNLKEVLEYLDEYREYISGIKYYDGPDAFNLQIEIIDSDEIFTMCELYLFSDGSSGIDTFTSDITTTNPLVGSDVIKILNDMMVKWERLKKDTLNNEEDVLVTKYGK